MQDFIDDGLKASIFEIVVRKFVGFHDTVKVLDSILDPCFDELSRKTLTKVPWTYFKIAFREALIDCSAYKYGRRYRSIWRNNDETSDQVERQDIDIVVSDPENHRMRFNDDST